VSARRAKKQRTKAASIRGGDADLKVARGRRGLGAIDDPSVPRAARRRERHGACGRVLRVNARTRRIAVVVVASD